MAIRNASSLDKVFHALGDESRRKILSIINNRRECTAGELVELFESAQPTISKHLKVLESAGLISRRIEGRRHFFEPRLAELRNAELWMKRQLYCWRNSLDKLDQHLSDIELMDK